MKQLAEVLHYYLPYKLKIETYGYFSDYELFPIEFQDIIKKCNNERWRWKPLLIPLSKLTKEIEHEGKKFVPKNVIVNWYMLPRWWNDGKACPSDIDSIPFYVIQKLLSWHFDIFGLIESGQAIEK